MKKEKNGVKKNLCRKKNFGQENFWGKIGSQKNFELKIKNLGQKKFGVKKSSRNNLGPEMRFENKFVWKKRFGSKEKLSQKKN